MRWRRRACCAAAGALLALTGGSAPAGALVTGIAESDPAFMTAPLFQAVNVAHARIVVPWNAALTGDAAATAWLDRAHAAGLDVLVAFERARGEDCTKTACTLPSVSAYRAALDAFRARWPWVTTLTPWNEPNHRSQPTFDRPDRAAAYYGAARAACPACTVVAGDLLDDDAMGRWLDAYRAGLHEPPTVWGLHDYYDATYFDTRGADTMLALGGELWLTETGGIVRFGNLTPDEHRAAESLRWLYGMSSQRPRIARMYVYEWQGYSDGRFDAGLLRRDGSAREGYDVVAEHVGQRPAAASTAATCASACATPPSPAEVGPASPPGGTVATPGSGGVRIAGKGVRLVRAGGLRVRLTCTRAEPCSAALMLTLARGLRPRRPTLTTTLPAFTTQAVHVRLPARTRAALARARTPTVLVTLCADGAACERRRVPVLTR